MDVIGNNIANVNTYGYKTSRATFSDVYYQTITSARPGDAVRGGTNPTQVGYGAQLASIDVLMGNGGGSYTGRAMDVYIDGDGFLTVQDADGVFHYTRLGNMSIIDNRLVDSSGNFVMGINLDTQPTAETIAAAGEDAAAAAEAAALAAQAAEDAVEAAADAKEAVTEATAEAGEKATAAEAAKAVANEAKAIDKAAQKIAEAAQAYLDAVDASDVANSKAIAEAKAAVKAAVDAAAAATTAAAALPDSNTGKVAAVAAALAATTAAKDADDAVNADGVSVDDLIKALSDILSDAAKAVSEATKAVADIESAAATSAKVTIAEADTATVTAKDSLQAANIAELAEAEALADFEDEAKITEANDTADAAIEAADAAEQALRDAFLLPAADVATAESTLTAAQTAAQTAADNLAGDPTDPTLQQADADAKQAVLNAQAILDAAELRETATTLAADAAAFETATTPESAIAKAEETAAAYAAAQAIYETADTASKEASAAARTAEAALANANRLVESTRNKAAAAAAESTRADAIAAIPPSGYATGKSVEPRGEGGFWTEDDMSAITFDRATVEITGEDGTVTEMQMDVIDCITNINIGPDGKMYGITMRDFKYGPNDEMFEKDTIIYLGQLAVALFPNQDGLSQTGMSQYDPSASSGNAQFTTADMNGAGGTTSGYLEMSNVELSQQFTDMITTQRGFQANSRIVTVSDEMLQELINMKR
jgi:flagellar hook protein FlgE